MMRLILPEDQFLNVLSYLVVESVFAISSTCRQLHDWCSLCKVVHSGDEELKDGDISLFVERFPAVNDLTLRVATKLTNAAYETLAAIGPQLVTLRVSEVRVIKDSTFRNMVCRFANMRILSLSGTFYVDGGTVKDLVMAGHSLQEVSLSGFRKLKEKDVQVLLVSCPYLRSLSVADCTNLESLHLASPNLCSLDVSKCIHISMMSLKMPALTRLDANWCTKLPDSAVESLLATCTSLQHLDLKGCSFLTAPNIYSPNLKSLDLSLCGNLTACNISCAALTDLSVAMCMSLISLNLDAAIMKSLDLSMLGLKKLNLRCNQLEYADLRGSYKLSCSSIRNDCPSLNVVDICGTDIGEEVFTRSDGEQDVEVIHRGAPLQWHTHA